MSKKLSNEAKDYKEGVESFNAWTKNNKALEKMGLYGTDYFVRRVQELEIKVKKLEEKLKRKV